MSNKKIYVNANHLGNRPKLDKVLNNTKQMKRNFSVLSSKAGGGSSTEYFSAKKMAKESDLLKGQDFVLNK